MHKAFIDLLQLQFLCIPLLAVLLLMFFDISLCLLDLLLFLMDILIEGLCSLIHLLSNHFDIRFLSPVDIRLQQITFEFQQGNVILQAQFLILQLSDGLHVECLKAGNLMKHQVITFCDEIGIHLLQALILLLQLLLPRADIQFVIH